MKYLKVLERILQSGAGGSYFGNFDLNELAEFRKVAIAKVRDLGRKVNDTVEYEAQWDGKTLNVKNQDASWTGADHPANIIHDLGHWAVCASKARRSTPDFGLGPGMDSNPDSSTRVVKPSQGQIEEERASILGILMELELGFPAADTLRLHEWVMPWCKLDSSSKPLQAPDGKWTFDSHNARGFTRTLDWLIRKNLVSTEGNVNWTQVSQGSADT